jgi:chemotaxis protein MotB
MGVGSNARPIIIKKKKIVQADGHHGGAWKVAYADFVTAMMAFFMLMWLLNATTEKQRKGIADYFSPTIAVSRVSGGGDGSLGGSSVFSENTLPRVGTGASSLRVAAERQARGNDPKQVSDEDPVFQAVEDLLMGHGGDSVLEDNLLRHVQTRLTDEGLIVEIFDLPEAPLFTDDNRPTAQMRSLARAIVETAATLTNDIAVEAHVKAAPIVLTENPTWIASAQRAEAVRKLLQIERLDLSRFARTTAHADREPASYDPMASRNNRIEIVFLRERHL